MRSSYSHPTCFWWQSSLSAERKQKLIDWVESLSDEDVLKLEDLLDDTRQDEADIWAQHDAGASI